MYTFCLLNMVQVWLALYDRNQLGYFTHWKVIRRGVSNSFLEFIFSFTEQILGITVLIVGNCQNSSFSKHSLKSNFLFLFCKDSIWAHARFDAAFVAAFLAFSTIGHGDVALRVAFAAEVGMVVTLLGTSEKLAATEAHCSTIVSHVTVS